MEAQKGLFEVSEQDKARIEAMLAKVDEARQQNEAISCIELEGLRQLLTAPEAAIVEQIFAIDPLLYGFKGPYVGIEPVPKDLVRIAAQPFSYKGQSKHTEVQYMPSLTYRAFRLMADALEADLERPLLIDSSYRSSVFQAITFLDILRQYDFDVPKTAARVAVPGYSEHGTPSKLALDFQNIDGQLSDDNPTDFENSQEYEWLIKNAVKFHFVMSYPRNNTLGVMFEPWHWRHMGAID